MVARSLAMFHIGMRVHLLGYCLPRWYSGTLLKINESFFDESLSNNSTELKVRIEIKIYQSI